MILTSIQLRDLTGYERRAEQRRVLDEAGIPWKELAGRTIVLTTHVEAWMTGKAIPRTAAPRMDLVR